MKKKEFQEMRNKSVTTLREEVAKMRKEADTAYTKLKSGQEKNTSVVRNIKRRIAQALSLIREKELLGQEEVEVKKSKKEEKIG